MKAFFLLLLVFHIALGVRAAHDGTTLQESVVQAAEIKIDNRIALSVNTTKLARSGDWVRLSWTGISKSFDTDLLLVYSAANVDLLSTSPIKYRPVFEWPQSWPRERWANPTPIAVNNGTGFKDFRLINMRSDYRFAYTQNFTVVAVSEPVSFVNYNEPLQGHLAFTGKVGEMSLTWVTKDRKAPQVKWGVSSGKYTNSVAASSVTYNASDLCGSVASSFGWRDPGLIHTAVMQNLRPGQKYFYIFGDETYGWSAENAFSALLAPTPEATVSMIAFGDMGKTDPDGSWVHWSEDGSVNTTKLIIKDVHENHYDILFHIGDLAYAVGYSSQWDLFFDRIEPIATKVPYMVCPGNHEYDFEDHFILNVSDSYGECGVPYEKRFRMPDVKNTSDPFYSIEFGPVHMVLMSTETNFTIGSDQWKFLEKDLKSVDRKKTPWIIFSGHRPMYIDSTNNGTLSNAGDQIVALWLRKNLEPLLYKYKVDLAWWGHHHSYQRTCRVFNETCVADGTTHLVIGMAGASLSENLPPVKPKWFEVTDDKNWGYTRLMVNRTNLHMQYITDSDEIADEFTLNARF